MKIKAEIDIETKTIYGTYDVSVSVDPTREGTMVLEFLVSSIETTEDDPFSKFIGSDEELQQALGLYQLTQLRATIAENVADSDSLLGTLADVSGLLTAIALADIVALETANNFDDYKTAKMATLQALAGEDVTIVALAGQALQKIQSGEVVLTATLKGLPVVLEETLTRSTQVAGILKAVQGQTMQAE